jgi:DHA2 family multidrug resistance protein-like MFS transporter
LPAHPTTADIVWRVALCGCGFGLFQSPNNRAIVASAPRERSGGAGAIQGTARLLGQSIGAALVALVFGLAQARGGHGAPTAIWLAAGFAGIAVLASLARMFDIVRIGPPTLQPARGEAHEPAE